MLFEKLFARHTAALERQLMEKYCRETQAMFAKMRGWRHDYRHHIQVMKVYAANGEYGAIDRYLDMLDTDLTRVETVVRTGNAMADAILNSKLSLAAEKQVPVKVAAQIPAALALPEVDLCIVTGNLLDNAIDACMALPPNQRLIRLYMEMKGHYLYLCLTNTAAGGKRQDFRTTKGAGHGLGLARVDAVVKKYGGYVRRASEEGAFSTEVLLPQENFSAPEK